MPVTSLSTGWRLSCMSSHMQSGRRAKLSERIDEANVELRRRVGLSHCFYCSVYQKQNKYFGNRGPWGIVDCLCSGLWPFRLFTSVKPRGSVQAIPPKTPSLCSREAARIAVQQQVCTPSSLIPISSQSGVSPAHQFRSFLSPRMDSRKGTG